MRKNTLLAIWMLTHFAVAEGQDISGSPKAPVSGSFLSQGATQSAGGVKAKNGGDASKYVCYAVNSAVVGFDTSFIYSKNPVFSVSRSSYIDYFFISNAPPSVIKAITVYYQAPANAPSSDPYASGPAAYLNNTTYPGWNYYYSGHDWGYQEKFRSRVVPGKYKMAAVFAFADGTSGLCGNKMQSPFGISPSIESLVK